MWQTDERTIGLLESLGLSDRKTKNRKNEFEFSTFLVWRPPPVLETLFRVLFKKSVFSPLKIQKSNSHNMRHAALGVQLWGHFPKIMMHPLKVVNWPSTNSRKAFGPPKNQRRQFVKFSGLAHFCTLKLPNLMVFLA